MAGRDHKRLLAEYDSTVIITIVSWTECTVYNLIAFDRRGRGLGMAQRVLARGVGGAGHSERRSLCFA